MSSSHNALLDAQSLAAASPSPTVGGRATSPTGIASSSVAPAAAPSQSTPLLVTHSLQGASGLTPTYPPAALSALEAYKKKDNAKVVVRFKAIGNAPIMKNNYFRITAFNRFQAVIQFLRKELGWKQGDGLFLYINSSFSPAPDDSVGNLFRCFGTEGHLIVNYSTQAAWG